MLKIYDFYVGSFYLPYNTKAVVFQGKGACKTASGNIMNKQPVDYESLTDKIIGFFCRIHSRYFKKQLNRADMFKNINENEKTQLRSRAIKQRLTLNTDDLGEKIRHQIENWPVFRQAKVILSYNALPGEVDLSMLITKYPDKQWYIPCSLPGSILEFRAFKSGDKLKSGPFGIKEPCNSSPLLKHGKKIDLILVPALMLDAEGNRLGFGKGYYDRFLAKQNSGVVFACPIPSAMLVKALPKEPWDVSMQWAITEKDIIKFS